MPNMSIQERNICLMKQINCTVTVGGRIKKIQWIEEKSGDIKKEIYQALSSNGTYRGIYKTIEEAKEPDK